MLAGGAVGGYLALRPDGVFDSPDSVALPPPPDDAAPTADFLNGAEGKLIVDALEATEPLEGEFDVGTCTTVSRRLDAIGSPTAIFTAAAGVPDGPTSEMAVYHLTAATHLLGECFEENVAPPNDEVRFTATVLRRRIEQVR